MDSNNRKKITVIHKYIEESFSEGDWYTLGQITGRLEYIQKHPRLLKSMSFGDEDYDYWVAEVINKICENSPEYIETIIDHYDIDIWYEQKDPIKYKKIFGRSQVIAPDSWKNGYLKVFISHLSQNKQRVYSLKNKLASWGISSFVAHTDIEPTKEWMIEIEKALFTMDILLAVIEPGFKESNWTDQEVGFALGRNVDIIPLRSGLDPYGFIGKYQGIQIKNRLPDVVAEDIVKVLLKKPKYRDKLILCISKSIQTINASNKIRMINKIDSWKLITDEQMKTLLENSAISVNEKLELNNIIKRCKAFVITEENKVNDSDIPF